MRIAGFLFGLLLTLVVFGLGYAGSGCGQAKTKIVTRSVVLNTNRTSKLTVDPSADYTGYCGQELASIKQLRDLAAKQIDFTPQDSTIFQLASLSAPSLSSLRSRVSDEKKVYTIKVHLDKMKAESDSDVHVGVSDGQGHHMIVEFIAPQCATGLKSQEITQARSALFTSCGVATNSFTSLAGQTATITGVGFFDKLHQQFDVAPNGIELHPVLAFVGCGVNPPSVTTETTTIKSTTLQTTVTTPNYSDNGPGCKKYPHRHWLHRIYHKYCRKYFYTTE